MGLQVPRQKVFGPSKPFLEGTWSPRVPVQIHKLLTPSVYSTAFGSLIVATSSGISTLWEDSTSQDPLVAPQVEMNFGALSHVLTCFKCQRP